MRKGEARKFMAMNYTERMWEAQLEWTLFTARDREVLWFVDNRCSCWNYGLLLLLLPVVLSIDIPTQVEPSFVFENCKLYIKNTFMYCSQKPVAKNSFISRNCLLRLLEPVLFYTAVEVMFRWPSALLLSKPEPVELSCWALQGECSALAPVSSRTCSVSTVFSLVFFFVW
jgi:hypothetical protein